MCLANIYFENLQDKDLVCKNAVKAVIGEGVVTITDFLGQQMEIEGTVQEVDLSENYIIVVKNA